MYMCVSKGKKCLFFRKFGVLSYLLTPVLRFTLLPYCRPIIKYLHGTTAFISIDW